MTAAVANTMSPRGATLLGAMRRNLELLVELEKTDPAAVALIVGTLVAHLRSWKPLAAVAVSPPLEAQPVVSIASRGNAAAITINFDDGAFCELSLREDGKLSLYLHDALEHDADVALSAGQGTELVGGIVQVLGGQAERWFVRYTLFGRVHRAGPYAWNDAVEHYRDIANFEGVTGCDYEQEAASHG